MKKLVILFFISCQLTKSAAQTKNRIEYLFSPEISNKIDSGFAFYKILSQSKKTAVCFILFSENGDSSIIVISSIHTVPIYELVKSTERFFKTKGNTQIPIIFKSDILYCDKLKRGKITYYPTIGGYTLLFGKNNQIFYSGLQQ